MFLSFPGGLARHPFALGNVASESFLSKKFQTKFHAYQIQVIQKKGSNCLQSSCRDEVTVNTSKEGEVSCVNLANLVNLAILPNAAGKYICTILGL